MIYLIADFKGNTYTVMCSLFPHRIVLPYRQFSNLARQLGLHSDLIVPDESISIFVYQLKGV